MKGRGVFRAVTPYLFIGPHLFFFAVFLGIPTFLGVWISLHEWDYLSDPVFVGIGNYLTLFDGDNIYAIDFWQSVGNTLKFVVFSVPSMIAVPLLLALLLNNKLPGRTFFRGVFYFPSIMSVSTVALIWFFLLDTNTGIVNHYLTDWFGAETIPWMTRQPWPWISIVMMSVWWGIGGNMILFLAGLQNISESLLEAASLDGANVWQRFWHITLPGLRGPMLYITIMTILGAFNVFGQPYLLTGGGPGGSTRVAMMYIFGISFSEYKMGLASAMSLMMGVIMFVFSVFVFRMMTSRDK